MPLHHPSSIIFLACIPIWQAQLWRNSWSYTATFYAYLDVGIEIISHQASELAAFSLSTHSIVRELRESGCMTRDFKGILEDLGLSQYHDAFVNQGFDAWDIILDIQESDLSVPSSNTSSHPTGRNRTRTLFANIRVTEMPWVSS